MTNTKSEKLNAKKRAARVVLTQSEWQMESCIYPAQGITVASIVLQYSLYLGYEGVGYHKANSYANKTSADGKISRQFYWPVWLNNP